MSDATTDISLWESNRNNEERGVDLYSTGKNKGCGLKLGGEAKTRRKKRINAELILCSGGRSFIERPLWTSRRTKMRLSRRRWGVKRRKLKELTEGKARTRRSICAKKKAGHTAENRFRHHGNIW